MILKATSRINIPLCPILYPAQINDNMSEDRKVYDLFISHASEDKDDLVRPLATSLERRGVKVWYDEFSLRLGDSLSSSIDMGIRDSRYGIVVLSPSFLSKSWPDYEYRSLLTREVDGERIILPLWYGICKEDVKRYSPFLADIKSLSIGKNDLDPIIDEVLRVVRPDLWREKRMRDTMKKIISKTEPSLMKVTDIIPSDRKRSSLTADQLVRCKTVFFGIGTHLNLSFQDFIDGYEKDMIPERELQTWEIMNACYLELIAAHPEATDSVKYSLYKTLLTLSVGLIDNTPALSDELLKETYSVWLANYHDI